YAAAGIDLIHTLGHRGDTAAVHVVREA
ncbi:MAG: hypothetical protein QOG07_2400, partial [Pseudonocardiales bacterium]|nr:hypothetical protein [Pseudonocardiales bacterium]